MSEPTVTYIAKVNTPQEFQKEMVKWLRKNAKAEAHRAAAARIKRNEREHRAAAYAFNSAADFIEKIKIEAKESSDATSQE